MNTLGVLLTIGTFVCLTAACTLEYDPVCGSDGETYGNECALGLSKRDNPSLTVDHQGECSNRSVRTRVARDIQLVITDDSDSSEEGSGDSGNVTVVIDFKDNGDDKVNITFGDENGAITKLNKTVVIQNDKPETEESKDIKTRNKRRAQLNCACPRHLRRMCGSDGVTYANDCLLECANKQFGNVKMAHEGPCGGKGNRRAREVSQESIVTEDANEAEDAVAEKENEEEESPFEESEDVKVRNKRNSVPSPCACPFILRPVCGNDGVTYASDCLLECVNKQNRNVKVAHEGQCGGIANRRAREVSHETVVVNDAKQVKDVVEKENEKTMAPEKRHHVPEKAKDAKVDDSEIQLDDEAAEGDAKETDDISIAFLTPIEQETKPGKQNDKAVEGKAGKRSKRSTDGVSKWRKGKGNASVETNQAQKEEQNGKPLKVKGGKSKRSTDEISAKNKKSAEGLIRKPRKVIKDEQTQQPHKYQDKFISQARNKRDTQKKTEYKQKEGKPNRNNYKKQKHQKTQH